MRNKYLPFIAIAIMTFFVACSNEELLPEAIGETNTETTIEETRTLSITATMPGEEDPTTRVTLEGDGGLGIILKWQAGDRLQFAFVQGTNKANNQITLTENDHISNDGKTVTFETPVPSGIEATDPFDLYGLYGYYDKTNNVGSLSGTDVTLTKTPGSRGTLERVQNRGDVMLYFESKNIDPLNPIATVNFKHLGSLFAISFNNTENPPATSGITGARLVGVDANGDTLTEEEGNWAYNNGVGGQIFDLVNKEFQEITSAGNYISFTTTESSWAPETTTTLWGWYPPLPNKEWPALRLMMTDVNGDEVISSSNIKPARATAPKAGMVYHFYARWDGTELNFTDDQFVVPTTP